MVQDTITTGGLVILLTLISGIVALVMHARKIRRENEADGRARTNELKLEFKSVEIPLTERLVKVEAKIGEFMPRSEIEAKLEHEKGNRQQADEALRRITDNLSRDVRDIMIGQSRIEQQHQDTVASVAAVRDSIKDLSKEIGARFDKVSSALTSLTGRIEA